MEEIVNKVAQSGLVTVDLEEMYPAGPRLSLDIAGQLWQGIALKEKDFRDFIKTNDWEQYRDAYVAVYCSADAIIPHWAYMLVASKLDGIVKRVIYGSPEMLEQILFEEIISKLNIEEFRDRRIVIKGCSQKPVPVAAYAALVSKLQPVAKSIMYGEPCSTVPVFKR
jgi:hypothetical protein